MKGDHAGTSALDRANTVIGLYGDPNVAWSIVLQAELATPLDPAEARQRLVLAVSQYPHLGDAPDVESVPADRIPATRDRFASAAYEPGSSLVRVAVSEDRSRLVLAGHHGAVDGLGLLALLGIVLDVPVSSAAAGVGSRRAGHSFLTSAVRRLVEALFTPPVRIHPVPDHRSPSHEGRRETTGSRTGDVLVAHHQDRTRIGAASFTTASAQVTAEWNRQHGARAKRIVGAVGASYRSGADPTPTHDSTFFRLRLTPRSRVQDVSRSLTSQPPEPDFPARSSRLARLVTRALTNRLGSTFLVSNLGIVSAGEQVRSLSFYPAASGRSGMAFGAVTVGGTSTITVRARFRDFGPAAAHDLVERLGRALRDDSCRRLDTGDVADE